ncbi:RVT_3 domain-containing protein [Cephalotus follicularis]|uniref:RVT_3 domain-containing protein n=1 Tax=Cephalotus follicularis TaxID=3775 RepID=A0A1Q3BBP1_CEPFO|nr:RVT_3 domain-containing protein [Cephalotus follicularis]
MINQINGEYENQDEEMIKYLSKLRSLISKFQYFHLLIIPWANNNRADILSKLATAKEIPRMGNIFREDMQNLSIIENDDVMDIDVETSWMDLIISWLMDGVLLVDTMEARIVTYKSNRFYLKDKILYKKSYAPPLLRFL